MTTSFKSFDEAYCFLLENGFHTEYDFGKRQYYPSHCISAMEGASAGRWLVSFNL